MLRFLSETAGSLAYTSYGAIEGETALREAYAAHLSALYGAAIAADHVQVTSGCNQAFICAAVAVAGAGDTVLMTSPFYFNQQTTLAMLGIKTDYVALDPENGFLPDPAAIAARLHPGVRAFALVSPNNPTGAVYPPDLLSEIHALCRANGTWLIVDETYRDFLESGSGAPHHLFSAQGWEDSFIGLYSFSKAFCIPGHRLGAITAGPAVIEQIAKIMDNLQICAPRSAQGALARAIPVLHDWREENRREIARRATALRSVMADVPDWTITALGAYFAYIRHPFEGVPSDRVSEALARTAGIVCLPGTYFGEHQEQYLRFAFANADTETLGLLSERLGGFSM